MTGNGSNAAFAHAIAIGLMSDNQNAPDYAGNFMFMGLDSRGRFLFKHIMTRAYLAPVDPNQKESAA
jgi:hypothetical protein